MFVIQPNGKIETRRYLLWLFPLDPTPRPGATVVVPERAMNADNSQTIQTLGIVAQVLGALATIVVISR